MNADQYQVLHALYRLEEVQLRRNEFDLWFTPAAVTKMVGDHEEVWVRQRLTELWLMRKVVQTCFDDSQPVDLKDVVLDDMDSHGPGEDCLPLEHNDCRATSKAACQQVAVYDWHADVRYRSRMAEVARMLSYNYQRFNMAPATGLLRYEKRPQLRPLYSWPIESLVSGWVTEIRKGRLCYIASGGTTQSYPLSSTIDREQLARAVEQTLLALADQLGYREHEPMLAEFQVHSISATLCGLYTSSFRQSVDAHVITAGVGSGKSYAFQAGAVIHIAYKALIRERGLQVLLLYPRVILAANQFKDLGRLIAATGQRLGITLLPPVLDAGGQLTLQMGTRDDEQAGQLYRALQEAYQRRGHQILVSNVDTLSNRLVHPEACAGLTQGLDLVVLDEIHILSGVYGAHARALLSRLALLRAMWRLRKQYPNQSFEQLLEKRREIAPPYFIAASATISGPAHHTARILSRDPSRIVHIDRGPIDETGWVHHLFLRQRPETSSITAVVNATSALIHNRRDGIFREYYQSCIAGRPISLDELGNPVRPSSTVVPRHPDFLHKTLGFCDSLDALGRWADLVTDNERTKFQSMGIGPNPAMGEVPYFIRFQEPLWRVVHHLGFSAAPTRWQQLLWQHYGQFCRDCKKGLKRRISRIPANLTPAQRDAVQKLWSTNDTNAGTYLGELGIASEFRQAEWFQPLVQIGNQGHIDNLDGCPFFKCGLCWWWSMDHLGSNHPTPVQHAAPVNGYLRVIQNPEYRYHPVNAIRVRTFTSNTEFDAMGLQSINEVYQDAAARVFRYFKAQMWQDTKENALLVIGSPRIEVGIDMDRVSDGITFRAMRDPASLQQKVGRVGREIRSDSIIVHVVTDSLREQFYFRNPRIALDAQYLQAIPLPERNTIVARNHYFMAIVDFLCLQGDGPIKQRIADAGERLDLVNDYRDGRPGFHRWEAKVRAVNVFLFGDHPLAAQNLTNLAQYLQILGASKDEITQWNGQQQPDPGTPPMANVAGAIDVFRHEIGTGLLLTPLNIPIGPTTLAQACSHPRDVPTPMPTLPTLPRHREFLTQLYEDPTTTVQRRSYLWQLLTMPLFRRGIPRSNMRGNQPYLWVPNLFESVGSESVRVFQHFDNGNESDLRYETVGLAISLLVPGTFTYRYVDDTGPLKVPVNACGCSGVATLLPKVKAVKVIVSDPDYYEPANCPPIAVDDLPPGFVATGNPVRVFQPRQIGLIRASSTPLPNWSGLIADGDEDDVPAPPLPNPLPTPPRCFPLRWYRLATTQTNPIPCRFQAAFKAPAGEPSLSRLPWPQVGRIFTSVVYDAHLQVTDFVWGLDRSFTSRSIEPQRLVYRAANNPSIDAIALGHHYCAPGLEFQLDLRPESPIGEFLSEVLRQRSAVAHQSLLIQVLHAFLAEHARGPQVIGAAPWVLPPRPSSFAVQHLKTVVLFHLLARWHPAPEAGTAPGVPFELSLSDISGCFQSGHPNYIDDQRFQWLCQRIARMQNPTDVQRRMNTLLADYPHFQTACAQALHLNSDLFLATARRVLLNTLGLTIHTAGLRQSGAEERDLSYFYREHFDGSASIFLFDTDAFGNGTVDLLRDHFYVSPIERTLVAKMQAMGCTTDPLPTSDFLTCFEETLQECPNSQSAHLAFHDLVADTEPMRDLRGAVSGERQAVGGVFDFLRLRMGLASFDHIVAFQACPEFIAYVTAPATGYSIYAGLQLVGTPQYPTYQSLESAMGFCVSGCIECVISPEQNVGGPLEARISVNKLLLDAMYRRVVCETDTAGVTYPGDGPGRTLSWTDLAVTAATAMANPVPGRPNCIVQLTPPRPALSPIRHTITPSAMLGGWNRVFRTSWAPTGPAGPTVRLRMSL